MKNTTISNKTINDIAYILSKRPDLNIYIDMLIFEKKIEKKKIFLKKIVNIKEISEIEILSDAWKAILLEYATEIKNNGDSI